MVCVFRNFIVYDYNKNLAFKIFRKKFGLKPYKLLIVKMSQSLSALKADEKLYDGTNAQSLSAS